MNSGSYLRYTKIVKTCFFRIRTYTSNGTWTINQSEAVYMTGLPYTSGSTARFSISIGGNESDQFKGLPVSAVPMAQIPANSTDIRFYYRNFTDTNDSSAVIGDYLRDVSGSKVGQIVMTGFYEIA